MSDSLKHKKGASSSFCPQQNAIKHLNEMIMKLQPKQHAIVLMLDANQTLSECFKAGKLIPYTIEWLRIERGMDDPFRDLFGTCPNSMTQTPNRDIDFILTYGIQVSKISTLGINHPAQSDHLGIILDLDMYSFFSSKFSDLTQEPQGAQPPATNDP